MSSDVSSCRSPLADDVASIRPIINDGEYGHRTVNVQAAEHDSGSLLNWMERALRVRRNHPSIGRGRTGLVESEHASVFIHRAVAETETVLAVHNFSEDECTVRLDISEEEARELVPIYGDDDYERTASRSLRINGYGYRWFRLPGEPPAGP